MALSLSDALNQYGFVGDLARTVPELKNIFSQAAREEWDPGKFERAVMDSAWFRTHGDNARHLITMQATDPASYNQTIKNAADKVYLLQREMGLAPSSAAQLNSMARSFLFSNYDDQEIRRWLALNGKIATGEGGSLAGTAAQLETHMRGLVANYGVPTTDAYLKSYVQKIEAGDYSLDGFESLMRARAKAAHPQFATQIDSGMTLRDIADPYIATMANTLELSQSTLNLNDANIKKALGSKQHDGTIGATPLYEFERQLKNDPRWDKTKQARTEAFSTIAQVGKDFGFIA